MKKSIIPFFILISFLFISCKQAMFEKSKVPQGYGTVVIGIAGNDATRAVDSDGLPVLKDSKMTIKVTKDDGTSITEKHFTESETKSLSLNNRPVGEKIVVKISVENVSARWFGSAEHTVTAGTNTVSVQLKKAAAALNSLLFGTNKPYTSSVNDYTFTLKIGSKEINTTNIWHHSFCRDNKARTYLAYQESSNTTLERYTSEGDKESKTFTLPTGCHRPILASDYATSEVYLAAEISGNMKLYRINEDGTTKELALQGGAHISYINGYAVHENILITSDHIGFKMYRINGDTLSEITLSAPQPNLHEDTKITLGVSAGSVHETINDLYMTKDALYLLFSAFDNHSGKCYSLGGIVKYSYTANGTTASISTPVRIGIANAHTSDGNGIYPTEESNFYGPVKVIGFDEQNLYIADDGIKFEYQKGKPRITANKNRIATLNKGANALTFNDAPSGITWLGENPIWKGVKTKTLVWKKNSSNYGFDYYQITQAADTLPSAAFGVGEGQTVGPDHKFTDVFCFDEAGNLYIVRHRAGGYCICRFELKDDGSYNQEPINNTLQNSPVAIAVDISGSVKKDGQSVNALYYSYDDSDKSCIKRLTWAKNAAFSSAAEDNSFAGSGTFEGRQDTTGSSKTQTRFTALAADKNGFYVGETFKENEINIKKHIIRVKKYAHNTTGYATSESTIEVVPETVCYSYDTVTSRTSFSLSENINALFIQDGLLYGVTAKEFKNEYNSDDHSQKASISGKLWKIGKTDAAFTTDTLKCLHSSEPNPLPGSDDERKEGGKFAPYRFIAVKPKKLIIASDGFYGYVDNPTPPPSRQISQYNFICTFELKDDGSTGEPNATDKGTDISFSKELKNQSGFPWEY